MVVLEKVKILVVGDFGVGKMLLVYYICYNESILNLGWIIGCIVEVKLYDYKEGILGMRSFFLEFWDVGGFVSYQNCCLIFYNGVNGLIFVYDLINKKFFINFRCWLMEVLGLGKDGGNVLYLKQFKFLFIINKGSWFELFVDIGDDFD